MNEKHILKLNDTEIGVYSKGAELFSYKVNGAEFIWGRNPDFWGASSPVLFPFVGVIKREYYKYGNNEYHMPTRHGFARNYEFELSSRGEDFLEFKFSSNDETLKIYPFKFDLYIKYTIEENSLEIAYRVVNNTEGEMYFSIGAHPAFALEINDEISLRDYYLELEKNEEAKRIPLLDNGLAFGNNILSNFLEEENKIQLDEEIFEDDAIIFENLESEKVAIKCSKSTRKVEMDFSGFPFIAFWSKPKAPFVCLEPWYGITDFENSTGKLENKKGILKLDRNSEFSAKFTIKAEL